MISSSSSPLQELKQGWTVCWIDCYLCLFYGKRIGTGDESGFHLLPLIHFQININPLRTFHNTNIDRLIIDSMQEEILYVKKLSENATIPVRGSVHAAGYDLFR